MQFLYREVIDKKDNHSYIEVTGYEGGIADIVVPEEIDGLKVEAIGNHAFSARQDLKTVSLPDSIRTIYGFAFHNCRNLKKITLYDSIDDYYDGVCRQCDSLEEVEITLKRGWYEVVRNFLADNDKRLRFRLYIPDEARDGEKDSKDSSDIRDDRQESANGLQTVTSSEGYDKTVLLTFPEYVYDFNENTMARTIQFSIAGSGMFYRECVDRRSINYREYDRLFEKAKIDGGEAAQDIALGRILYPIELDEKYRLQYEEYIRANGTLILERLIPKAASDEEARETLKKLLSYRMTSENSPATFSEGGLLLSEESFERGIRLSSDSGLAEISAILMEYSRPTSSISDSEFSF